VSFLAVLLTDISYSANTAAISKPNWQNNQLTQILLMLCIMHRQNKKGQIMPAEHMRPTGLSQGYFCYTCGMHCNMVGTGHGPGVCEPNPKLVEKLIELNRGDRKMKTVDGAWVDPSFEVKLKQLTLGEKLAKTIDELEAAKIKELEANAAADLAKVRKERQELFNFVDDFRQYLIDTIVAEKVPARKVSDYDRQRWVRDAVKGSAKHQDIWNGLRDWAREQRLVIVAREGHDGMSIALTAEPVRPGTRGV
jgi:hypothetical protein